VTTQATTTTKTTGNWWDFWGEPQYGGRIVLRTAGDPTYFDSYYGGVDQSIWQDCLVQVNSATNPDVCDFKYMYVPMEARAGQLAESWEKVDLQTVIFHIRKGVRWQDIAPMNGRELTAYDVEYTYHRMYGLGSGYTKSSPYRVNAAFALVESATATDKYTFVIKWKQPAIDMIDSVLDFDSSGCVVPPEGVKQWGDLLDWRHAIGTGPFILKNYVSGASLTYIKNPNYWGYDERYPKNQLPYADGVDVLIIPDQATTLAALRTNKIDIVEDLPWQQGGNLIKDKPDLVQVNRRICGMGLEPRCDKSPYTDLRVRKAMQMAIDLPTIAKTYYGGTVDPSPFGLVGPALKGYYTPFDEWPQEVKYGFTYNPAGAKKLLAEAGYPNGFKTNCVTRSTFDLDILQVFKAYLLDIGIDMEIRVMDSTSFTAFVRAGKQDALIAAEGGVGMSGGMNSPLNRILTRRFTGHGSNNTYNLDATYDAMVNKFNTSLDLDERRKLMIEADMYSISHYWSVNTFALNLVSVCQPWLKGYAAQVTTHGRGFWWARWWVNQNVKKQMTK
jgi:ABC-type transport system substrate-binding protein